VQRALALGPQDGEALQLLGLCQVRLGDLESARRTLREAVAADPRDAHAHYLLGHALVESSQLDEAEPCHRAALQLAPDEPVYLRGLAELLAQRRKRPGELVEALELARRAVALGPDRAANHITLGYCASAAKERDLARRSYRKALELEPNNSVAWNNLGCVDLADGHVLLARERFRESLRVDPEGRVARDNLDLVSRRTRPEAAFYDFAGFERQLVIEVWEDVLFSREREARRRHSASGKVSAPLSPGDFFRNYLNPFPERPPQDDPHLHAAALLFATEFRQLKAVWWRLPQVLAGMSAWLGLSVGLLRLGPAGVAVALLGNASAVLLSRRPLRIRTEHYRGELLQLRGDWQRVYDGWLSGALTRTQRDHAMGALLDGFCRTVEALLLRLPAAGVDDPDSDLADDGSEPAEGT
jgi:Flp pilus assembly protein TadD